MEEVEEVEEVLVTPSMLTPCGQKSMQNIAVMLTSRA